MAIKLSVTLLLDVPDDGAGTSDGLHCGRVRWRNLLGAMMKPKREYYYRGLVERGGPFKGYRWANGYSANGPNGEETQPWLTKRECYAEAKADGVQAVFIDNRSTTK